MNHEAGLRRNNDLSTLLSGFNCCAIGLGVRVFTQPGPKADIDAVVGGRTLVADHAAREADQDRREGREPWPVCHLPIGWGCRVVRLPWISSVYAGAGLRRNSSIRRNSATNALMPPIRLTSPLGPGCVKTRTPRPISQQLNPEGIVDESLLRRRPTSGFNISSRSLENRFHTAWVKSGSPAEAMETSASGGRSDIIRPKADISLLMSEVGGKAEVDFGRLNVSL